MNQNIDELHGQVQFALQQLYHLRSAHEGLKTYLEKQFNSMDFRRMKKNRTVKNRCQFINEKKKKACAGYVCKKSKTFCYAHYTRAISGSHTFKPSAKDIDDSLTYNLATANEDIVDDVIEEELSKGRVDAST